MTGHSASSFLATHSNPTILEIYLQLLAEDKIRRDARLQELTEYLTQLRQEVNQQHLCIRQLQQDLNEQVIWRTQTETIMALQDRLLEAYRADTQYECDTRY